MGREGSIRVRVLTRLGLARAKRREMTPPEELPRMWHGPNLRAVMKARRSWAC